MAIRKYKRKDKNGNICAPMTTAEQVITANENVNLANTLGYLDRADVSSDSFHVNKFVANGIIQLYGEHTSTNKGLPIQNASSGHTISGKLFVLDSTINEREVCVTQVLMLSNRVGNDGAMYVRTGSATSKAALQDPSSTSWGAWQKQQGLKEMNVVYDVMDIDKYTESGMYSGIIVNSTSAMVGGLTIETGSTFLIVTLNGYASEKINKSLTPQCTQMLYLVASGLDMNTGEIKLKPAQIYTRTGLWTGTMYSWGDWNNITDDDADISTLQKQVNAHEEAIAALQQTIKYLTARIEALEKGGGGGGSSADVEDGTLSASASVVNEVMSVQGSVKDGILKL